MVDKLELDWWELTSLFILAEVETAPLLLRLAASGSLSCELYATRADWPLSGRSLPLRYVQQYARFGSYFGWLPRCVFGRKFDRPPKRH